MRNFIVEIWLYWVPIIMCMFGIFLLSHSTTSTLGQVKDATGFLPVFIANTLASQYSVHITEFGVLSALVFRLLISYKGVSVRLAVYGTLAWAISYGVLDEIHQSFIAGRTGALSDVGLDSLGALLGLVLIFFLGRYRRRPVPR